MALTVSIGATMASRTRTTTIPAVRTTTTVFAQSCSIQVFMIVKIMVLTTWLDVFQESIIPSHKSVNTLTMAFCRVRKENQLCRKNIMMKICLKKL